MVWSGELKFPTVYTHTTYGCDLCAYVLCFCNGKNVLIDHWHWAECFYSLQGATGQSSVNPAFQDAWSSDED